MAKAKLFYKTKLIYSDGAIREMVIWDLPNSDQERPHGLKYRLYYGNSEGECLVRYDNEKGKGDHKHIDGIEKKYNFQNIETLVSDFQKDIDLRRKNERD